MGTCKSSPLDVNQFNFCTKDFRDQDGISDDESFDEIFEQKQSQNSRKKMAQLNPENGDQGAQNQENKDDNGEVIQVEIDQLQQTQKLKQEAIPDVSDISDNYSVITLEEGQGNDDDQTGLYEQEIINQETEKMIENKFLMDKENPGEMKLNKKMQPSKNTSKSGFLYSKVSKDAEKSVLKQLVFSKPTEMQEIIDQLPPLPKQIKLQYKANEFQDQYFYIQPTNLNPGYIYRGQWGKYVRQNLENQAEEMPNGFGEQFYFIQKKKLHPTNQNKYQNQFVLNIYYIGDIVEGKANGFGRMIQQNGTYYEGYFYANKFQGQGILKKQGGFKLEGNFEIGHLQGYGVETWPDGSVYKGNFKNGKKHGEGSLQWKGFFVENEKYWGEFVNDQLDGFGIYNWKDGRQYKGNWKGGKMHGYGEFYWPNGSMYKGFYENGKKQGYGIIYFQDHCQEQKHFWEGYFQNGKLSKTDGYKFTGANGKQVEIDKIVGYYVKGEFAYKDQWVEIQDKQQFPELPSKIQNNKQEKQYKRVKGKPVRFEEIEEQLLEQRKQIQKAITIDKEQTLNVDNLVNLQNQISSSRQNTSIVDLQMANGFIKNSYQPQEDTVTVQAEGQIQNQENLNSANNNINEINKQENEINNDYNNSQNQNQSQSQNQNQSQVQSQNQNQNENVQEVDLKQGLDKQQEVRNFEIQDSLQIKNEKHILNEYFSHSISPNKQIKYKQVYSSGNVQIQPTQFNNSNQNQKQQQDFNLSSDALYQPQLMADSKHQLQLYQQFQQQQLQRLSLSQQQQQQQQQGLDLQPNQYSSNFQIDMMSTSEIERQYKMQLNKLSTKEVPQPQKLDYKKLTLLFQDESSQQSKPFSRISSEVNQSLKQKPLTEYTQTPGKFKHFDIQDQIQEQIELENRHSSMKQDTI